VRVRVHTMFSVGVRAGTDRTTAVEADGSPFRITRRTRGVARVRGAVQTVTTVSLLCAFLGYLIMPFLGRPSSVRPAPAHAQHSHTHTRTHTHTWPLARRFGGGWQAFEIYGGEVGSDKVPTKKQVPPARPLRQSLRGPRVGAAQSRCRCGRGEPSPGADVAPTSRALAALPYRVTEHSLARLRPSALLLCARQMGRIQPQLAQGAIAQQCAIRPAALRAGCAVDGASAATCCTVYYAKCYQCAPALRVIQYSRVPQSAFSARSVMIDPGSVRLSRVRPPAHAPALQGGAPGDGG
jgi:hypothetical protein